MELQRRGMELDTTCVVCNRLNEDGGHMFFKCKYAVKVRKLLKRDECRTDLAIKQSAKEKTEEHMRVIVLLWQWWQGRNKVREGNRRRAAEDLAYMVQKQASEFPERGQWHRCSSTQDEEKVDQTRGRSSKER